MKWFIKEKKCVIKSYIERAKPIGLLFVPNMKTVLLLYVLLMFLMVSHVVNAFVGDKLGDYFIVVYDYLSEHCLANWLTFVTLSLCGIILSVRVLRRRHYSWQMIGSVFAICYLLMSVEWSWVATPLWIDYRWFLIVLFASFFVCGAVVLVKRIRKSPRKSKEVCDDIGFSVTTEQCSMQDTGWKQYAENLAVKLRMTNVDMESFAVGISGAWGSGKTTFLNAVKDEIKGDTYLVEFNPWNSDSAVQISNDFFKTLISQLTISSYQKELVVRYAKMLGQIDTFEVPSKLLLSLFDSSDASLEDAKQRAEGVIASMPLPVVVLIDDLDRLEGAELMAVLRLVRITANFRNLIFVVTYDKTYVSQTLAKVNVVNGEEFLKKIFPLEVCLPAYESYVMSNHLYEELRQCLNGRAPAERLRFSVYNGTANHRMSYYLPTFRDVKRFVNQFSLNINSFVRSGQLSEINIVDFFYLELLHYHDFSAYQFVQNYPHEIFSYSMNSHGKYAYYYRKPGSITGVKSIEDDDKRRTPILNGFRDGVTDILWCLFGMTVEEEGNHARYLTNFDKYFSYRINQNVISLAEFGEFLKLKSEEEIEAKIKEYVHGGISKKASLKNHLLLQSLDISDEEQVFNIAYAILELACYGGIDAPAIFKQMFDKTKYPDAGVLPDALMKAIRAQIGRVRSHNIIQDVLTSLVEWGYYDPSFEDSYRASYASVLGWNQIQDLAEENFLSALHGRTIPVQLITDKSSNYHDFLSRAVAKGDIECYDGEHETQRTRSLLARKLTELYSGKDNRDGLAAFFDNLNPWTDDMLYMGYDFEDVSDQLDKNIASVFGKVYDNEDFYTFVKAAFANCIPELNAQLKKLKMPEVKVENPLEENYLLQRLTYLRKDSEGWPKVTNSNDENNPSTDSFSEDSGV